MLGWLLIWPAAIGLLILSIILCVMTIVRALTRPVGAGRHASCGSCGYELNSLASGRCPECGADHLKGGVVTGSMAVRMAGSMSSAIVAWTIIAGTATTFCIGVSAWITMMGQVGQMGGPQQFTADYVFKPDQYQRASGSSAPMDYEAEFNLDVTTQSYGGSVNIELTLRRGGSDAAYARYDASASEWVATDAAGTVLERDPSFTDAMGDALFNQAGLPLADPATTTAELDDLKYLARDATRNPMTLTSSLYANINANPAGSLRLSSSNQSTMNPFSSFASTRDIAIMLGILGGGAIVYVVGLVLIIRRRTKVLAIKHDDPVQPPIIA